MKHAIEKIVVLAAVLFVIPSFVQKLTEAEAQEKKTPLNQGLAEAQKLTAAFMDCLDRTPNKSATCAAQVDPKYQGYNTEDPPEGGPGGLAIGIPRG